MQPSHSGCLSGAVRTIDLRIFAALHCGVDVTASMAHCSWCGALLSALERAQKKGDKPSDPLAFCGRLLGSLKPVAPNTYRIQENCSHVVWTYSRWLHWVKLHHVIHTEPLFFRDEKGELTAKLRNISDSTFSCPGFTPGTPPHFEHEYLQEGLRKALSLGLPAPKPSNIVRNLGRQGSGAAESSVLSLSSTMHYFDLEAPLGDPWADKIRYKWRNSVWLFGASSWADLSALSCSAVAQVFFPLFLQ